MTRRPFPVFPDQRTFSGSAGMSQTCTTTEVAFSLDHLVGEHEKRRDREAERRSLGSPHGLAPGLVRGFQRFNGQKSLFRPKLQLEI
jgi:hypothetical protein